jgi:hypothetical protein
MATSYTNVLSAEDIHYLNQLPEVFEAKSKLDTTTSGKIYFSVNLTESIRNALASRFGVNLSNVTTIPMRWIKGDTAPHVDVGKVKFDQTYLVYLNSSPGELVVDNTEYPILENTGYTFNEGLSHTTHNTGAEPRLMIGPMSEQAFAVGAPTLYYFPSETDALNYTNQLGYNTVNSPTLFVIGDLTDGTTGGFTTWKLASNSTGASYPTNRVFGNGDRLLNNNSGNYNLYPANPCFLEGSTILCQVDGEDKYIPVEQMKVGTLVKTSRDGYKKVELIGKGTIKNPGTTERLQNRLYKCSSTKYPELKDDLIITGCHSILVDSITDAQREETIKQVDRIFITDKKYRLMACVDDRAEPWTSEGTYTIWHFALENTDVYMNYGVYANGGLLVETSSLRFMKNHSNMTFV